MASNDFQLRAYVFLDSLQPQLAQYMAKTNRVYDPKEYDAALFVEIAPAMEIHVKIDQALKATNVRLGSMVTERVFGMMQVHHSYQGEVHAAGQAVQESPNRNHRYGGALGPWLFSKHALPRLWWWLWRPGPHVHTS